MTPTIGRIVHYYLTAQDAERINLRRVATNVNPITDGYVFRTGNLAKMGDELPAMVVRVNDHGSSINAQVSLDGNDTHWVTSVAESEVPVPGNWCWPPRV